MATDTGTATAGPQPILQPSHRGAPAPNPAQAAVSPPSKRELASWWKKFSRKNEKDEEKVVVLSGIFGVPLAESIRYANVAISLTNEQGESFIYGYVPIVVAKCGVFLKEKATDVEGIFRLSGSAKRIKDLQAIFNSPERYGKGLDWTGYTVHDAANILRRYLNQLPEPIVPLEFYERFRDPLRAYQLKVGNRPQSQATTMNNAEHNIAVVAYQKLITELPALNRQLLLYILDLLAVFASKADLNRMTAQNLAAIFQPGIISHPVHDMAPLEYRLSQDVLIFLIENQDNFLIGMTGTAVDEQTQKDVESGAPSLKSPKTNIGRSSSNASAGADSLRKFGVRRNVSVSPHTSRERGSPATSIPGTPSSPSPYPSGSASGGIARSNTVPSKRSPAIGGQRFQRITDSSQPSSPTVTPGSPTVAPRSPPLEPVVSAGTDTESPKDPKEEDRQESRQEDKRNTRTSVWDPMSRIPQEGMTQDTLPESTIPMPPWEDNPPSQPTSRSPIATASQPPPSASRERKISNLFSKSPLFGPSDPQAHQRQPKKLQKRQRIPGSINDSAQSSQASLHGDDTATFHTPMMSPGISTYDQSDPLATPTPAFANTAATPTSEHQIGLTQSTPPSGRGQGLMLPKSPTASLHSRGSMTDPSEFDALDDPAAMVEKRRHRFRLSSSAKNGEGSPLAPPPPIGQLPGAKTSNSSLGSNRLRQSFTADYSTSQPLGFDTSNIGRSTNADEPTTAIESEKKGFFGKMKAKISGRDSDKERAKSPPRVAGEHGSSKGSLMAIAQEHFSPRGRSFDRPREESLPVVSEQVKVERTSAAPQHIVSTQAEGSETGTKPEEKS